MKKGKKLLSRILAMVLAVVMVLTMDFGEFTFAGIDFSKLTLKAHAAGSSLYGYQVGKEIYFGEYPSTAVTNPDTNKLIATYTLANSSTRKVLNANMYYHIGKDGTVCYSGTNSSYSYKREPLRWEITGIDINAKKLTIRSKGALFYSKDNDNDTSCYKNFTDNFLTFAEKKIISSYSVVNAESSAAMSDFAKIVNGNSGDRKILILTLDLNNMVEYGFVSLPKADIDYGLKNPRTIFHNDNKTAWGETWDLVTLTHNTLSDGSPKYWRVLNVLGNDAYLMLENPETKGMYDNVSYYPNNSYFNSTVMCAYASLQGGGYSGANNQMINRDFYQDVVIHYPFQVRGYTSTGLSLPSGADLLPYGYVNNSNIPRMNDVYALNTDIMEQPPSDGARHLSSYYHGGRFCGFWDSSLARAYSTPNNINSPREYWMMQSGVPQGYRVPYMSGTEVAYTDYVTSKGTFAGVDPTDRDKYFRPVMHINLDVDAWNYAGTVTMYNDKDVVEYKDTYYSDATSKNLKYSVPDGDKIISKEYLVSARNGELLPNTNLPTGYTMEYYSEQNALIFNNEKLKYLTTDMPKATTVGNYEFYTRICKTGMVNKSATRQPITKDWTKQTVKVIDSIPLSSCTVNLVDGNTRGWTGSSISIAIDTISTGRSDIATVPASEYQLSGDVSGTDKKTYTLTITAKKEAKILTPGSKKTVTWKIVDGDKNINNPTIDDKSGTVVWDRIAFGSYEAKADGTKAPIEWRVLNVTDDGKATLLAESILDSKQYIDEVTGEDLESWVEKDFKAAAFNADEKPAVDSCTLPTAWPSADSELAKKENGFPVTDIMESSTHRIGCATSYAKSRGLVISESDVPGFANASIYWCRQSGGENYAINTDGSLRKSDLLNDYFELGVRPVITIDIDKAMPYYTIIDPMASTGSYARKPTDMNLVYTGEEQPLIKKNNIYSDVTYYYGSIDKAGFSTTVPKAVNAGTYVVKYYYELNGKKSPVYYMNAHIQQRPLTNDMIVFDQQKFKYTGEDITVAPKYEYINPAEVNKLTSKDIEIVTPAKDFTKKKIGTYPVTIKATPTGNFQGEATASWQITTGDIYQIPKAKEDLIYNGSNQILIKQGYSSDGFFTYSLTKDGNYTDTIPTAKNAGTYKIYFKLMSRSGDDISVEEYDPVEVTIGKKTLTESDVEIENPDLYYTASGSSPTIVIKSGIMSASDYSTSGNVHETDVGKYKITVNGENNYTGSVTMGWQILSTIGLTNPAYEEKKVDNKTVGVGSWDTVYFGSYWQNDTNGDGVADKEDEKEPIKWRVLKVDNEGNNVVLMSDKILDQHEYYLRATGNTWNDSDIKSWLNNDEEGGFLYEAFKPEEKLRIISTEPSNEEGDPTTCKVYLLSDKEASFNGYGFQGSADGKTASIGQPSRTRMAVPTDFAAQNGVEPYKTQSLSEYDGGGYWWLRGTADSIKKAIVTYYNGNIYKGGTYVADLDVGIRPVIVVNLNKSERVESYDELAETGSNAKYFVAGDISSDGTGNELPRHTKTITYDGENHDLAVAGMSSMGSYRYSLSKDGTYNTFVPSSSDAGEYTVYCQVYDSNGEPVEGTDVSFTSTIEKKDISKIKELYLENRFFEYDGEKHSVKFVAKDLIKDEEVNLTQGKDYELSGDISGTVSGNMVPDPAFPDDKSKSVFEPTEYKVTINGTENYTGSKEFSWFIMAQGSIVPPVARTWVYDGEAHNLIDAGSFFDPSGQMALWYRIEGQDWSKEIPTAKDAGTYVVQYVREDKTASTLAKTVPEEGGIECTVSPCPVKSSMIRLEKDGAAISNVFTETRASGEKIPKAVKLTGSGRDADIKVSFNEKDLILDTDYTLEGKTETKDTGDPATTDLKPGSGEEPDVRTYQGIYTFTVVGQGNFTGEAEYKWQVMEAGSYRSPAAKKLTYDGSVQELIELGFCKQGSMRYAVVREGGVVPDDSSFSFTIPTGKDAGKYDVYFNVFNGSSKLLNEHGKITVEIKERKLTASMIKSMNRSFRATGSTITVISETNPVIEDTLGVLEFSKDYDVETSDRSVYQKKEAGTYYMYIKGIGNYTGSIKVPWQIYSGDIEPPIVQEDITDEDDPGKTPDPEEQTVTWTLYRYGSYLQNDTNGDGLVDSDDETLPIYWRVLGVDGTKVTLISDTILDARAFDEQGSACDSVSWKNSTVRSWLNGYDATYNTCEIDYSKLDNFINKAFTEEEQKFLQAVNGDKVTLLNSKDATKTSYGFISKSSRIALTTDYAVSMGAYSKDNKAGYYITLGNKDGDILAKKYTSNVSTKGEVKYYTGTKVNETDIGIRPVIVVDTKDNTQGEVIGTTTGETEPKKPEEGGQQSQGSGSGDEPGKGDSPIKTTKPVAKTITYDGKPHELVGTTGLCVPVTYSDAQSGTYTAAIPKATNAGTYTIWYKTEDGVASKLTTVIKKRQLTSSICSISPKNYDYTGSVITPTITVEDKDFTDTNIIAASDYKITGDTKATDTKVGYKVVVKATEEGNYDGTVTLTWNINNRHEAAVPDNSDGISIWNTIYMGAYYQSDNNEDGKADTKDEKEPIRWRILTIEGDEALVVAENNLAVADASIKTSAKWEASGIRTWLNKTFINDAFDEIEQAAIVERELENGYSNKSYPTTDGGKNTKDKVFLLSMDDVTNPDYGFISAYKESNTRSAAGTAYTENCGANVNDNGCGYYWLRTPGKSSSYLTTVSAKGVVNEKGYECNSANYMDGSIRPAMWIKLSNTNAYCKGSNASSLDNDKSLKPKAVKELVYDGKEHKLIKELDEKLIPKGVTVTYSIDGKTYSPELPKAKNAGSYSVISRFTLSNGSYSEQSTEVSIAKRDINGDNVDIRKRIFVYTGQLIKPDFELFELDKNGVNLLSKTDYECTGDVAMTRENESDSTGGYVQYRVTMKAKADGNYYGETTFRWYIIRDNTLIVKQAVNISDYFDFDKTDKNGKKLYEGKKIKYRVKKGCSKSAVSIKKDGTVTPKKATESLIIEAYYTEFKQDYVIGSYDFRIVKPTFKKDKMYGRYTDMQVDVAAAVAFDDNVKTINASKKEKENRPLAQDITYSAKSKLGTIDPETGIFTVTGTKSGKVSITVTYTNVQGKTVKAKGNLVIKIPKLSKAKLKIKQGKATKLSIKDVVNKNAEITWSSDNPEIARYNENTGKVEAVATGNCTITANVKDNGVTKQYTCAITVK